VSVVINIPVLQSVDVKSESEIGKTSAGKSMAMCLLSPVLALCLLQCEDVYCTNCGLLGIVLKLRCAVCAVIDMLLL